MATALPVKYSTNRKVVYAGLVFILAVAFSAVFLVLNNANYNWLSPRFEQNGTPTTWGIIQRLYLIVPALLISLWRGRQIGFQMGRTYQYWRMLIIMLVVNVVVIGGYVFVSGSTPYSGPSMLFNEAVTVPLVEEVVWRGVVFAVLLALLRRFLPEGTSGMLAGIYSGICFGLLHANNALYGYPLAFVALQTLNATVWGVVYGIARAKTGSLYPSILLHSAMNLVVALGPLLNR